VTDLFNYAQPLIRYRLGDFGTLSKKKCSCGITLPVIDAIHGRAYDLVRLSDGRTIHPEAVMYIFEELQSSHNIFHQFQVIQNTFTDFLVFVVPTNKWEESHKLLIRRMLQQKLKSNIQVEFKVVSKIDRESSGKMRVIKSRI
jgi:phenylacetate-CoA ligase